MSIGRYFRFLYHWCLYIMQQLFIHVSYLCRITLVSIWFRMTPIQIITWVYKDFFRLEIHTKYEYMIGITNLIPMGWFFDTIVDVAYWYHASTYIVAQHWSIYGIFFLCCYHDSLHRVFSVTCVIVPLILYLRRVLGYTNDHNFVVNVISRHLVVKCAY